MAGIFKKPKIEVTPTEAVPAPNVGDEAQRIANEVARRRRGRGGRKSTLLTAGARLGAGAEPFRAFAAGGGTPRKTATGAE
ncbi:MAG: hypothetical protein COA84_07595 [Robiginitomaculum sp.]|nr:MAG: hypothetical protein COA84_07595 [Robiginitomaculum sp.]